MNRKQFLLMILTTVFIHCQDKPSPDKYFGLTPPADQAILFAPGIVSDGLANRDITITPDGKEIYWATGLPTNNFTTIFYSRYKNNKWSTPEILSFSTNKKYSYLEPHISPDGKKLFFLSDMPDSINGKKEPDFDIWVMYRNGNSWSKPYNIGSPVNTDGSEFYPSTTTNGDLYFCRKEPNNGIHYIYVSKFNDGKYSQPEKLPQEVNSGISMFNAFIAPDGSYIIVPTFGRKDTKGGCDYYISFRKPEGNWTKAINMGVEINSEYSGEWSASVSPDGKYLFFLSPKLSKENLRNNYQFKLSEIMDMNNQSGNGLGDVYWIKTDFINKLRDTALGTNN